MPNPTNLAHLKALLAAANLSDLTSHHIVNDGYNHLANLCTAPDEPCFVIQHRKEVTDWFAAIHNSAPALIAEIERYRGYEAEDEYVQAWLMETIRTALGRRDVHGVPEGVEDLAKEVVALRARVAELEGKGK